MKAGDDHIGTRILLGCDRNKKLNESLLHSEIIRLQKEIEEEQKLIEK